jgi:hypothetical protein
MDVRGAVWRAVRPGKEASVGYSAWPNYTKVKN